MRVRERSSRPHRRSGSSDGRARADTPRHARGIGLGAGRRDVRRGRRRARRCGARRGDRVGSGPAAADVHVDVGEYFFAPSTAEVARGGTVVFDFVGGVTHTATDASGLDLYDSGNVAGGGPSFSYTFVAAGEYRFVCSPHPFMGGRVRVPVRVAPARGDRPRIVHGRVGGRRPRPARTCTTCRSAVPASGGRCGGAAACTGAPRSCPTRARADTGSGRDCATSASASRRGGRRRRRSASAERAAVGDGLR